MALRTWDSDSDVESVTIADGNTKVNTDPAWLGELALWGDNFGEVFDTVHWTEGVPPVGIESDSHSVVESGGKLTISVTEAAAGFAGWGIQGSLSFPGDFNRQVELDITTEAAGQYATFRLEKDSNNFIEIFKYKAGAIIGIYGLTKVNGAQTFTFFATGNTTPKFKLIRSGTTLECWYDVGAGWVKLHEYTGATSIGTLYLYQYLRTRNGGNVVCEFNNLVANSGFPVWDDSPELIGDPIILAGTDVTCDMSTFSISTAGAGNVKHKYKQSGAWSGTWLTEGEMQALGEIQASHIKHQFNSTGQQAIRITSAEVEYSVGAFDLLSRNLGKNSPLLEGGLLH